MTKAELEARVRGLEGQLAAFAPDSQALAHLDRLAALALPLEQRNVRQPELDAAVERFRVYAERDAAYTEAYKGVMAEQAANRLTGQEVTALAGVYRQMAEVSGILRVRRGGLESGRAQALAGSARDHANLIKFRAKSKS